MKRKNILTFGSLVILTTPLAFVISCGTVKQQKQEWQQGDFLEAKVQQSNARAHVLMPEIKREKIKTYNQDLSSSFGVPLVSGGFGEVRHFYSSKNHLSVHIGDDAFAKAGTKVYAPFNGEVIAVWGKSKVGELGGGFGTQVVMRVQAKDLDPTNTKLQNVLKGEKYVYLTFGHLSLSSPTLYPNTQSSKKHITDSRDGVWNWSYNTSIDFKHPFKVKRGDVIGKVGTLQENGGWVPHVHVEAYKGSSPRFSDKTLSKYVMSPNWTDAEFLKGKYRIFSNIKGLGVYMMLRASKESLLAHWQGGSYTYKSSHANSVAKTLIVKPEKAFVNRNKIIDPNLIYKLWDKDSKIFTLK